MYTVLFLRLYTNSAKVWFRWTLFTNFPNSKIIWPQTFVIEESYQNNQYNIGFKIKGLADHTMSLKRTLGKANLAISGTCLLIKLYTCILSKASCSVIWKCNSFDLTLFLVKLNSILRNWKRSVNLTDRFLRLFQTVQLCKEHSILWTNIYHWLEKS